MKDKKPKAEFISKEMKELQTIINNFKLGITQQEQQLKINRIMLNLVEKEYKEQELKFKRRVKGSGKNDITNLP